MFIGAGLFFFLFFVVGIGSLVISIMTVVDASKYPDWAFERTGSSKFVWQVLPIILIFVCGVAGGVMGLVWYTSKRAEVAAAAQAAGPAPYGAPPPGWGAPPAPGGWAPPPSAPPPYAPPPSAPPPYTPPPQPPQPPSAPPPPPGPPAEPPQ